MTFLKLTLVLALSASLMSSEGLVCQSLQSSYPNIESEFVLKHVEDQYKLFVEMRNYLAAPWLFDEQRVMFHVDKQLRNEMLEKYYTFDPAIVREFIGKRLTEKMRPALTDLGNRVLVSTKSTVRQFENIRRIFKWATSVDSHAPTNAEGVLSFADEHSTFGSMSTSNTGDFESRPSITQDSISHHAPLTVGRSQDIVLEIMHVFQLPKRLSRKYSRIVYAAVQQFELDKKKLAHLKYKEIDLALSHMIKYWGSLPEDDVVLSPSNAIPNVFGELKTSPDSDAPTSSRRESKASSSPRNPSALSNSSPGNLDAPPNSGRTSYGDLDGTMTLSNTNGLNVMPPSGSMQFPMSSLSTSPTGASSVVSSPNWYISPTDMFPALAPHPKISSRLSQIKALVASHKADLMNSFVDEIRKKFGDWKEQELASAAPDPSRQGKAESLVNYKFIKSFFRLGTSIGQTKDFKKIFTDILEDIVQPCIDAKLTSSELAELMRLLQVEGQAFISASLGPHPKQSTKKHLGDAWNNYINGLKRIAQVLGGDKIL